MLMRVGTGKARIFQIFCSSPGKFLCWNAQDSAVSISFVVERVPTGIFLEAEIDLDAGIGGNNASFWISNKTIHFMIKAVIANSAVLIFFYIFF